jgi:hypothetical protein
MESEGGISLARRFLYQDEEWEVELTGTSHGAGPASPPPVTTYGVVFRSKSNPDQGIYGSISQPDLAQIGEEGLRKSLETALATQKSDHDDDPAR